MPLYDVDEARYHLLQAYDRLCIAQHYADLETIRNAKESVHWAYLVARAVPKTEGELERSAAEPPTDVPS